jgi:oligopeptide transport system substrate-binding protein
MCAALLLLLSLFVSTGCAKKRSNVERGNIAKELYIGIGTEPEALDPHLVTGVTEHYVLLSLLEGLVTRNGETLAIEPGVAHSWERSTDGLTYTFHLDPAASWSNGDPVLASDFLFSFERILSPVLGAPYAYMLYPMRGAEAFNTGELTDFSKVGSHAPDDQTLVIELSSPTPYFLGLLTHFTWWPVHPPTVLKYGSMTDRISDWTKAKNFVGNGPFSLKSWRLNSEIEVVKNPHYRAADSVQLNGIHFLPIEGDAEERAFRAGHIHISSTIPTHRIDWYQKNRPDNIRFDTYLGTYYYAFNVHRGPLADARVRKALAYSVNREELTKHVLRAGQKPAYNFTPPETGGYSAEARFRYDPEKARQLLAEAGFPNGEGFPSFELLYNTSESHRTIALAIQQMWKRELGIDITLYNQEWKVYLASRKKQDFDIVRAAWIGDYDDANTFLGLATSNNGNNHSGWGNAEYDALIDRATKEQTPAARFADFQQAESILLDEMPFLPIYFYVRSLLINESVQGWHANVLDYHPYQSISLTQ